MKKLNKISKINEQTFEAIQAYYCSCECMTCLCSCTSKDSVSSYGSTVSSSTGGSGSMSFGLSS